MKKAVFFDPYLDTLGGGERYTLTFAKILLDEGWQVSLLWKKDDILKKAEERFNLNLGKIEIFPLEILNNSLTQKYHFFKDYQLYFHLSDGSVPLMFAKKNLLHFQVPFKKAGGRNLSNRLKLKLVNEVVCNSFFTKKIIDKEFGVESQVLYPPVAVEDFYNHKQKEKVILAVGRFEQTMQAKRQDVLVEVFKKMIDSGLKDWQLVLAGASLSEEGKNEFLGKLKKETNGYPVSFMVNIPFQELKKLYWQAAIFWHAAGFGVNEEENPEKVEHFGITTIEAIAAGCWPLVYEAGGQREIFASFPQKNLCLWHSQEELAAKTLAVIENQPSNKELTFLAQKFSVESFAENAKKII